ncbi:MAG: hypothetical protein NVSMB5_06520 [Candidatus Velthaea sp.]
MTIVVIMVAAAVLLVVGRSGAAMSHSYGAARRRHVRNIGIAAAVLLAALFVMKGAGFVVAVGLLLPLIAIGIVAAIIIGIARRMSAGRD